MGFPIIYYRKAARLWLDNVGDELPGLSRSVKRQMGRTLGRDDKCTVGVLAKNGVLLHLKLTEESGGDMFPVLEELSS